MAINKTNGRSFEGDIGVVAYVTAHQDGNIGRELDNLAIDQKSGVIRLPNFLDGFAELTQMTDSVAIDERRRELQKKLPSHFTLQIAHHRDDDRVIVAQRERGDRYRPAGTTTPFGELIVHNEPPCEVRSRLVPAKEVNEQGLPLLSVWLDTQMQTRHGSNRADIIRVSKDGKIALYRVLIVWIDGHFRLVSEPGWEGQVYLSDCPELPYKLQSLDMRIISAFRDNDDVKSLMQKYVFVPDFGYPSIEGWLQMLLLPKFRQLVTSTTGLDTWEDDDHFWSKPEAQMPLEDNQAVVEWYVHGTGGAAMGYVRLAKPIVHKGRKVESVQIKHHSVDAPVDVQGLKKIKPRSVVRVHKIVDMDVGKTQHAPLAFVGLIYDYREEGEEPANNTAAA